LVLPTESGLVEELSQRGFEHLKTSHFSLEYNPFGWQQSLLNFVFEPRDELFESFKGKAGGWRFSLVLQRIFFVLTLPVFVLIAAIESACHRGGTIELLFQKRAADREF
jgi:hypothetical protein